MPPGPFARDAAHACWEAIRPAVVDFPHALTARARDTATDAGGRHGDVEKTRYTLVNLRFIFILTRFWPTDLIAG